jgi:CubicO group peptidase (beta-lactamase class C family)
MKQLHTAWSRRVGLALVALLALVSAPVPRPVGAQAPAASGPSQGAPAAYGAAVAKAQAVAQQILGHGVPGLALAVAVDGKIVWSDGFGYADLEERVPARATTKFRIGSVSKPLTAAALMRLVEVGKLDLDAPVQKYVPSFPDKGAKITARMLAGHLAGIRHYNQADESRPERHYDTVLDGLKIFQDDPLVVPPGTKFSYSSYGYNLLSAVIEGAAGESFLGYMQRVVFDPLGLRATIADEPSQIIDQRSRFYHVATGKPLQNAPFVDNSYKWAGGGFLSTAQDLVRFGSSLLQPGFLKAESLALLFTPQKTSSGQETTYGIGWDISRSKSGKRIYAHSGGSVGGTTWLIVYPDKRVVVAFVCNFDREGGGFVTREDIEKVGEAFERGGR